MIRDNTEKYVHIRMYRYIVVVYFICLYIDHNKNKFILKKGGGG